MRCSTVSDLLLVAEATEGGFTEGLCAADGATLPASTAAPIMEAATTRGNSEGVFIPLPFLWDLFEISLRLSRRVTAKGTCRPVRGCRRRWCAAEQPAGGRGRAGDQEKRPFQ